MAKILMISPNLDERSKYVIETLTRLEYKISAAENIGEAVEIVRNINFDLVLIYRITGADVVNETIAWIKKILPAVPVIISGPVVAINKEIQSQVQFCADKVMELIFCIEQNLDQAADSRDTTKSEMQDQYSSDRELIWKNRHALIVRKRLSDFFSGNKRRK